jgi:1-acyl-sn-glycerol-3-phosphate acyltransferase
MHEGPVKSRALPRASPLALKLFVAYSRRYMRRRFHAIRILKSHPVRQDLSHPLLIYLNHASWWDPLLCLDLARRWFPNRSSFAPMDAASVERYRIFKHIGIYAVEQGTIRGAAAFLRTTCAILSVERNIVWLTPQGRFTDVRESPVQLRRGIGALAARLPQVEFLPLAVEYTFWAEPRPEVLISFGEATVPKREVCRSAAEWTDLFSGALQDAQAELARHSCRRDPLDWLVLDRGASGVGAIYDTWRMLRARLSGTTFSCDHQPEKWT